MFIEFELFSIEESCLLNLICGDFLLFCEFCGIVLGKNMISKAKILKINKLKNKSTPSLCLFQCCYQSIYKAKKLKLMIHLHIFTIAR